LDVNAPVSVAFLVDGEVRNDLIYYTKFRKQLDNSYFVLEHKYKLFVESKHYVSCVVQIGDEAWVSEKTKMNMNSDRLKTSLVSSIKCECLEGSTDLSSTEIVRDLFRKHGCLESTASLLTNEYKKPKMGRPSKHGVVSSSVPFEFTLEVLPKMRRLVERDIATSSIPSEFTPETRCENERTKFFMANFEDEEEKGMTYAQSFYLSKFRGLLVQISKMRNILSLEQISRLTSLGYVPNVDTDLYTFTYVIGCICEHCDKAPIGKQTVTMMVSFAFPMGDSELHRDLVDLWSYFDIFRHPLLNYNSIIHLSPSLEDTKYGYTIFNISVCFFRKSVSGLQKNKIIRSLICNVDKILRWYDESPDDTSVDAFNKWVDQSVVPLNP